MSSTTLALFLGWPLLGTAPLLTLVACGRVSPSTITCEVPVGQGNIKLKAAELPCTGSCALRHILLSAFTAAAGGAAESPRTVLRFVPRATPAGSRCVRLSSSGNVLSRAYVARWRFGHGCGECQLY